MANDTNALVAELMQGWELARKLEHEIPMEFRSLARGVVASWERAMALVKDGNLSPAMILPDSPRSSCSDADVTKKRKIMHKWTTQVKVCSGAVVEGAIEDGFSWRKYGQKDILGATFPRGYYRCTHRSTQGCMATKQVQRSDHNPTIFDVTYCGKHTCRQQHQQPQLPDHLPNERHPPVEFFDQTTQADNLYRGPNPGPSALPSNNNQQIISIGLPTSTTVESEYPHLFPCNITGLGSMIQSNLSDIVSAMVTASTANSPAATDLSFGLEFDTSFLDPVFFI